VIGSEDREVRGLLARLARERGAKPVRVALEECTVRDIRVDASGTAFALACDGQAPPSGSWRTPLIGTHQAANAALALVMLDAAGERYRLGHEAAASALARVRLPGRFHRWGKFIFDVAHNPDGARVVAQTLRDVRPTAPVIAVLSVLGDKDWRGIMDALSAQVDAFVLTNAPTAPASRAWDATTALAHAREAGWRAELRADFDDALAVAAREGATVLVTGSFHTVGDAMARLQVDPVAG
jgi:dihydrofolate synthase/folylpolyglutamate synthase